MKRKEWMWATIAAMVFCMAAGGLSSAGACSFNTDCQPGSKCVKASGALYGVCVGGISPGNKNDQQPVSSPTDPNGTYGNTCSFDTDCGPGSVCVKSSGIYGTCMRRR